MGYASCIGHCYTCGIQFSFNPNRVPSIHDKNGVRQPICQGCITKANIERKKRGLPEFVIPEDAYTFCDEAELQ